MITANLIKQPPQSFVINRGHSLANGLVFFAPLNEGAGRIAKDLTGYTNANGTLDGTNINFRKSNVGGQSRSVVTATNGSNARVNFGQTGLKPFTSSATKYTVSVWVKAYSTGTYDWYFLYGNSAGQQPCMFRVGRSTTTLFFQICNSAGVRTTISSSAITANTWYHVVGVRDGDVSYMYVNGVYVNTATAASAFGTNYGTLYFCVGGSADNSGNNFNGEVSNPMVWNRCLSFNEIQEIYQQPYCVLMQYVNPKSLYLSQDNWVQAISDSVTLTDTLSKNISTPLSDSVTVTDSLSKQVDLYISDLLSLSESLNKEINIYIAENVSVNDLINVSLISSLTPYNLYLIKNLKNISFLKELLLSLQPKFDVIQNQLITEKGTQLTELSQQIMRFTNDNDNNLTFDRTVQIDFVNNQLINPDTSVESIVVLGDLNIYQFSTIVADSGIYIIKI